MDLVTAIQNIVRNYLQNENPADVVYATYKGSSIKVDDRPVPIDIDMVDIPEHLKTYNVKFSFCLDETQCDEQVFIYPKGGGRLELSKLEMIDIPCKIVYDELKIGDRVAIVQKQDAQRYSIIDKVTE